MPKLIVQASPEQDNQASTTYAKEVKHSLLFSIQFRFLHCAFLMPEDKTCQGNIFLLHVNDAIFAPGEACLVFTNENLVFLLS